MHVHVLIRASLYNKRNNINTNFYDLLVNTGVK